MKVLCYNSGVLIMLKGNLLGKTITGEIRFCYLDLEKK